MPDPTSPFERIRRTADDGSSYWSARELAGLLGYDAVEDVDKTLAQLQQEQGRSASAPSSAAAPAP
jgi:hypothetical protein